MCGVPASTLRRNDRARLLAAGHKVAVSEQASEDGGDRPLRLLTPGTSVEAAVLAPDRANNLTVAFAEGEAVAFAWIDLSTGRGRDLHGRVGGAVDPALGHASRRRSSGGAVAGKRVGRGSRSRCRGAGIPLSDSNRSEPSAEDAQALLAQAYGPDARAVLRGFSPPELRALTLLLDYTRATVGRLPEALLPPRRAPIGGTMEIDAPTLRGLEVLSAASGRDGALLSVLDRTVTPPGARLLNRQLRAPLTDPETIRLAAWRWCATWLVLRRCELGVTRACSSRYPGRTCYALRPAVPSERRGPPRPIAAVRDGLAARAAERLQVGLKDAPDLPAGLVTARRELGLADENSRDGLAGMLSRALVSVPPATTRELGFVAEGYDRQLDACRAEAGAARNAIARLQDRYIQETGIKSLKVRTNNVLGYHLEVPASSTKALGSGFSLRQGLASSTRYSTAELDRLATAYEAAIERAAGVEEALFRDLSGAVLAERAALARIAHAAAALDLVCGLAQAAAEGLWSEPQLSDDTTLEIEGGRHPVAERLLEALGRAFIANDCYVGGSSRLWVLTGPNMAGKSTFLRQAALIALMAQIGSFVPAARARIGVVDKMFSRIGAADDLAAGAFESLHGRDVGKRPAIPEPGDGDDLW